MRLSRSTHRRLALGTAAGTALLATGCSADQQYANGVRPPMPITVSAIVGAGRVTVSPNRFGAGPVTLIVSNETARSQELVLESADDVGSGRVGVRQQAGPINPQGTFSLKVTVRRGLYELRVDDPTIRPARVVVGRERPSTQNELLEP